MLNTTSIIAAALVAGASLTAGLDGIDASIDSLITSKKMEQHAICTARIGSMLLPVAQRADAEASCKLFSDKEIDDRYAQVKNLVTTFRVQ